MRFTVHWGTFCRFGQVCVCVCVCVCARAHMLSHVQLFATPWVVACQAPLSVGLSHRDTGVHCYFLLQGIVPSQGLNLHLLWLLHWQADILLPSPWTNIRTNVISHVVAYRVVSWPCKTLCALPVQFSLLPLSHLGNHWTFYCLHSVQLTFSNHLTFGLSMRKFFMQKII